MQMDAKYDPELEIDATNWIEQVLGERVFGDEHGPDNTQAVLKSGVVLCRYVFILMDTVESQLNDMLREQ